MADSSSPQQRSVSDLIHCTIVAMVVTAIKVMLVPTYHSTDMEVHRNWMAVTYHVPLSAW
jgi:alpha-1,3-glucosyltransferase